MNNYKSFSELKEELGNDYDFKLYEMGISALKEIENLEQQVKNQKDVIDKINNYIDNYDVFKVFSFPLMKKWEENQVKSSIDYEFKTSLIKDLKDILKEVSE